MTTAIQEYSPTEQALAELRNKYAAAVFDCSTGKGMDAAKEARAELRGYRIALEKKRVEIKAPALERSRLIDTEAKRITAEIEALEDPIDDTIKAEEQRKEREKAAKAATEAERLRVQGEWFDSVKALPLNAMGSTAAEIRQLIIRTELFGVDHLAADMRDAGKFTIRLTQTALRAALDARLADDERQAQINRDLAELAKRREQDEADQRAREELATEQSRLAQAAADARDAAARKEREEAAAQAQREAQALRDAEAKKLADERAELELERQERAAAIAAEDRKRAEVAAAEQQRLAAERAKLEADKKAAAKKAREDAIAGATLREAAAEALELLKAIGQGENIVTLKLASALAKEGATA